MSNKIKYVDMKSRKNYFFDDIINKKNFDPNNPNNTRIDEKSKKKNSCLLHSMCTAQILYIYFSTK